MVQLILYAVPYFVVFVALEWISFEITRREDLKGYDVRDSRTSITMGLGNLVVMAGWKLVVVAVYAGVYELTPLRMDPHDWWVWPILFFADDLAFYTYHRVSHEVRVFWASHVVHHSSEHYNLSTALRQPWVVATSLPFWLPLAAVGFKPWMIVLAESWSLIYQFGLHTERIGKLPRPIEFIFNTPSHHRVHHGSNEQYLDKNYGGILIIWDRMFGTFQGEDEKVVYGLTKNIRTFNPLKVVSHEYAAIVRDVRGARSRREKLGYLFGGPGWTPDGHDRRADELATREPHPDAGTIAPERTVAEGAQVA